MHSKGIKGDELVTDERAVTQGALMDRMNLP